MPSRAGRCQATWAGTFVGLAGRWAIHTTPSSQRCQHGAYKPQTNWASGAPDPSTHTATVPGHQWPWQEWSRLPILAAAVGEWSRDHYPPHRRQAQGSTTRLPQLWGVPVWATYLGHLSVHHRSVVQHSCCRSKQRSLGVEAWTSFIFCLVCDPLCANRSLGEDWAGGMCVLAHWTPQGP